MRAYVFRDRLWMAGVFEDRIRIKKAMPGARYVKSRREWWVPATPAFLERVLQIEAPGDVINCPSLAAQLMDRRLASQAVEQADSFVWPWKLKPWDHQRRAVAFAANQNAVMLHMWMGTGKSCVALNIMFLRKHMTSLVLCPKSVIPVWKKETEKHYPGDIRFVPLLKGTTAKRAELMLKELALLEARTKRPVLFALNYEAAWRGALAEAIKGHLWDCLILDESHRIKSAGGKASCNWPNKR